MIIAIDIGGTKTLTAGFDENGHITHEERFPTPQEEHLFLQELLAKLASFSPERARAMCVAVPGLVDQDGVVLRCGRLPWKQFPLKKLLSEHVSCPVFIDNDANLAGLGEVLRLPVLPPLGVYVTVSTGIGTGIIANGELLPALGRSEGGHMVFRAADGKLSTWEDFASGRAIHDEFKQLAIDIADKADWNEIADHLAVGLRALVPLLQPNMVIIGGSIGTHFAKFGDMLQTKLREQIPNYIDMPQIIQAAHPEESVVYGCYSYVTQQTR